jgi:hypothetical protein
MWEVGALFRIGECPSDPPLCITWAAEQAGVIHITGRCNPPEMLDGAFE